MARNRVGLVANGLEEYMNKLEELGGTTAMKKGAEAALKASKQYVNPLINQAMATGNLPAGGKYSFGDTKESIDDSMDIEWSGLTGEIKIGFDFSKSGTTSIFLMEGIKVNGTPRMTPVKGLKAAIYGNKTKKAIAELQGEALTNAIKEIMEG